MTIDWPAFRDLVNGHQRFLLTSHIRPDCDALGSELGMARILESLGKHVRIVNGHPTPPNLAFIDPENRIAVLHEQVTLADLEDVEVLCVLDTSAWAQLGPMAEVVRTTPAKRVILDHHLSEDDLKAISFKNTAAPACGVLVAEAAEQLGVALTADMAMPLFAAIATDTGWFRFPSVSSDTYRVGGALIDAGASPAEIYQALYEQDSAGRVRLRGAILARVAIELDGRLAHTYVLNEDFAAVGALPGDTEDVINLALAIRGVEFAVILVEQKSGGFKVSFRSRCALDCSRIAEQFEGGGHRAAAGATVAGSLEDVQTSV